MTDVEKLRQALEAVNSAWIAADVSALRYLFHDDMVIEGPDYQQFARGRDACVESYREFACNAKVLTYKASEPAIQVWADTAVCSYSWSMTWQTTEEAISDVGTDQFVFARVNGQWLAVYRLVLFQPTQT